MMLCTAVLAVAMAPAPWYGPAEAVVTGTFSGNPWDAVENDIRVRFSGPGGANEERLAYYDGKQWRVRLVARRAGRYTGAVYRNGQRVEGSSVSVELQHGLPKGFVRRGAPRRFKFDDGSLYWPVGFNLGWQSGGSVPDMTKTLADIGANGGNWSRIWACHWDGKNPWWPNEAMPRNFSIGHLWPKALDRWDDLVDAAQDAGVHFQFVLFHHGQWTTRTNPNWNENPWSTENGGFLDRPNDFFTNDRAKRLAKNWLRYAVARYGHSPSVMAWELFNEVEWVDAIVDNQQTAVGAWHQEMTDYLRSIDPYDHLVTTSSHMTLPIYVKADYYQPHGYPPSVSAMILARGFPNDGKPLFFGEVGPGQLMGGKPIQVEAVRDGIWSAVMAQHSGAGQYWTWENVYRDNLFAEYKKSTAILNASGILSANQLQRIQADMQSGQGGDLILRPGGGWEPTTKFVFNLPADAEKIGELSSYFQGKAHPEMRRENVRFVFRASKAGKMTIATSGAATEGGTLTVRVNGNVAAERNYPGGQEMRRIAPLSADFPQGQVTVELSNSGADWVQIQSITFQGVGERASGIGIGNRNLALFRVRTSVAESPVTIRPKPVGLLDGNVRVEIHDLDTGKTVRADRQVRFGTFDRSLELSGKDHILVVKKR